LFLAFIVLEEGSIMVHITLYDTEISTCLNEKEEDIMMASSVVDGNGLQNLKKFRIGESVREECVENSD
jgi:hypothetical protein